MIIIKYNFIWQRKDALTEIERECVLMVTELYSRHNLHKSHTLAGNTLL